MNAFVLLTEAGASPFLRDNEFFCNAIEWILRDNANVNELMLNIRGENRENAKGNSLRPSEVKFNCSQSVDPRSLFAASKSKTSLTSFTSGSQVTYKSWYNLPNQYFDSITSKCDHVPMINYLVDYQSSAFIPAILTPRIDQQNKNELTFLAKKDDNGDDIGIIFKLVDKLKEKMANPSSVLLPTGQSSCSIYVGDKETAMSTNDHQRTTTGATSASHRSNVFSASSQTATYTSHPLSKTFITQRQESELPIIHKAPAPKLLAHEGRSKTTIKDGIPKIFECYTGDFRTSNYMHGFRNKSAFKTQKSESTSELNHHASKKNGIVKNKLNRDTTSKDVRKEVTFNLDA